MPTSLVIFISTAPAQRETTNESTHTEVQGRDGALEFILLLLDFALGLASLSRLLFGELLVPLALLWSLRLFLVVRYELCLGAPSLSRGRCARRTIVPVWEGVKWNWSGEAAMCLQENYDSALRRWDGWG